MHQSKVHRWLPNTCKDKVFMCQPSFGLNVHANICPQYELCLESSVGLGVGGRKCTIGLVDSAFLFDYLALFGHNAQLVGRQTDRESDLNRPTMQRYRRPGKLQPWNITVDKHWPTHLPCQIWRCKVLPVACKMMHQIGLSKSVSINQSINQSKPVTPCRRWGTPTVATATMVGSTIIACPQRGAMMTSTGTSIPWCCPSTIYAVYLCDAFHPRSPVVWSSAAYHGDRRGRTMIALDVIA